MSDIASIEYCDVTITYFETSDDWRFTLRGVDRKAKTLLNAKAAIDKPAPESKKPFVQFEAYRSSYGDGFAKVTVTSIAGTRRYNNEVEVWVSGKNGRSKEVLKHLIAITPENETAMKEHVAISKEIKTLTEKQSALKFSAPTLPKDTEMPE